MQNTKNKQLKVIPLLINLLIPTLGGFLVWYINRNAITYYGTNVKKPFFTPFFYIDFTVIISILYTLKIIH